MNRLSIAILVAVVAVSLFAGCGVKEKISEKIGEEIAGKIIGEDVDVGKNGEITIKGEDGSVTVGATQWPDSKLLATIPKFDKGTISSSLVTDTGCSIYLTEVEKADFSSYLEKIKSEGFTNNTISSESEGDILYVGQKDKYSIAITYNTESKEMSITLSLEE